MPDDNSKPGSDPNVQSPNSQPRFNSLDGFTNTPRQPGPPVPASQPNSDAPKPAGLQPGLPQTMAAQNPQPPTSSAGIGGVAKPTVTGLQPTPQVPPMQPEQTPGRADAGQPASPFVTKKKSKKKLWLFLIVLFVLLLLGAGYVFAFYLPNTPENVYKSSLQNTGMAVDKLIDYSHKQQQTHYKSYKFDGKLNVKSPDASFDSTLNGNVSGTNGQVQISGDFMSNHVKADVRYLTKQGNTSPDVYLQVSGVKSILNSAGAGAAAKYDGKWIVIDHTFIDTYVSSLQKMAQDSTGSDIANADKTPTSAQVQDAVNKVQTVNKQYIFTDDKTKAVLTQEQFIGKETVNGRTMYHYKVGYNKAHLQAYVTAVGQALDSSQLNDWSKKVNNGKSITEAIDIKSVHDAIDKADTKSTFEMWADKGTKLISMLKFSDAKNSASSVTISQNYMGGVVYPFSFGFSSKGDDGSSQTGLVGFTVNSSTNKVGMTLKADFKDTKGTTTVDGSLNITPGNNVATVTAPTGATPVMDILKVLGLGELATPPITSQTKSPATKQSCTGSTAELSISCAQQLQSNTTPGSNPTKCPVTDKTVCAKYGYST